MAYVPNATNAAEPLASESVESAALEFRTLKASITARVDNLTATVSTNKSISDAGEAVLDGRLDVVENQLTGIALGTDSTALAAALASTGGSSLVGFSHSTSYPAGSTGRALQFMVIATSAPFNADNTGATDATAAIQAAIDFAATNQLGKVYLPAGKYRCDGVITVKQFVNLIGATPTIAVTQSSDKYGTTLTTTANGGNPSGQPFLTMHYFSGVHDLSIFYPNQANNLTGAVVDIVQYPATIQIGQLGTVSAGNSDGVSLRNVSILNPWNAIDLGDGTNDVGQLTLRDVITFPLNRGIRVRKNKAHAVISNLNITAVWWQSNPALLEYVRDHTIGIEVDSQDAIHINDSYLNYIGTGILTTGGQSWVECESVIIDEVERPIVLNSPYRFTYTGGTITRGLSSEPLISIQGSGVQSVTVSGTIFIGGNAGHSLGIYSGQTDGLLAVTGCTFYQCAQPAVVAMSNGTAVVSGCVSDAGPLGWHNVLIRNGSVNGIPAITPGADITSKFTNIDFSTWSAGSPTGWSISAPSAVTQVSGGVRISGTGNVGMSLVTTLPRMWGHMLLECTVKFHRNSAGSWGAMLYHRDGTNDATPYKSALFGQAGFATSLPNNQPVAVLMPIIAGTSTSEFRMFFSLADAADYYEITNIKIYAGAIKFGLNGPEYSIGSGNLNPSVDFIGNRRTLISDAIPTDNAWQVGDTVDKLTPTAGQPKRWRCTVAGTPGTWASEGNL